MSSPGCGSKSCRSYPCTPVYGSPSFFSDIMFNWFRSRKPPTLFNFTSADIEKKKKLNSQGKSVIWEKCIEDENSGILLNLPAIGNVTTS